MRYTNPRLYFTLLSRVQKFYGAKVLGTFAAEERKFQGCESSMEWKFLDFSLHGSECSRERKYHGNESLFHLWTFCSREGKKCRGMKSLDAVYIAG